MGDYDADDDNYMRISSLVWENGFRVDKIPSRTTNPNGVRPLKNTVFYIWPNSLKF